MKLKDINEIKEDGLVVFMPSGIQATIFNEGKTILVKYYNLKEDRYTIKDFKKVIQEGIEVFSNQPTIPQQSVLMESVDKDGDWNLIQTSVNPVQLALEIKLADNKLQISLKDNKLIVMLNAGIEASFTLDNIEGVLTFIRNNYPVSLEKDTLEELIDSQELEDELAQEDLEESMLIESADPELDTYKFSFIAQTDEDVLVTDDDGNEFELSCDTTDREVLHDELEEQMDLVVAPELCEYEITGTEIVGFQYDEETGEGSFEFNIFYDVIDFEDESMEESILTKLSSKGFIRNSLFEAYKQEDNKPGDVYTALKNKKKEYITAEFKNELLTALDQITREYPNVKVRQQARIFLDELGLQEYYNIQAIKDFCKKYLEILNKHVNESMEKKTIYYVCLGDEQKSPDFDTKEEATKWAEQNYDIDDDRVSIESEVFDLEESIEDYTDPQGKITLRDAEKEFNQLVKEAADIRWQGPKFIDITGLENACPAFTCINWDDIVELIKSWGFTVYEDEIEEPAIALDKNITEAQLKQMIEQDAIENGYNESLNEEKLQYGVEYRDMHTAIHNLIVTDTKEKAEEILELLNQLENPDEDLEDNAIIDNSYIIWDRINQLANDVFEVDYRETEQSEGTYNGIYIINYGESKPDIWESLNEDDNTYQVLVGICGDEESMQVVSIEDSEEDAIERAKYEYSHSDLDEDTCVEVVWVENGETIWNINKNCEYKLHEAYHPAYDNNRYYVTFDGCEGQVFYAKSEEEAKKLARKDFFTKDFEITGVEYLGKLGEPKNESLNGDIVTVVDIPLVTEKLYNRLVNILYGNKQDKNRDYEQQQNVLNFLQEIEDRIPLESGISIDLEDYGFTADEINAIKKIVRDERVDESLNEMNDRTVYNVKQARRDNFRNSGYNREEGIKFGKNDTLYNQRIKSKGLSIEDGIDNLVHIGFDKLSAYKPTVVKSVKEIMTRACELGLAEPYDFGRGKGKYRTDNTIEDVIKGLLDDKIAREVAMNYVNKQNKGAGLPLRTDESLNEDENSMAEEIRRGNKSGQDPKFGNWLLETSLDEKWEQLTNDMKLYLMNDIADYVQQGSLKEQDLLLEIDPESGLTKEDIQSLEMFDQEEIDYTFSSEDLQLNAYVSYEIKTDLDTPKDMEESLNEDEDSDLGLYIQTTGELYKKHIQDKKDVDWDALVNDGIKMYKKEIENKEFSPEEKEEAKEYLKNYFTETYNDPNFVMYNKLTQYMMELGDPADILPEGCTTDEVITWIFEHNKEAYKKSFWITTFNMTEEDLKKYHIAEDLEESIDEAIYLKDKSGNEVGPFENQEAKEQYLKDNKKDDKEYEEVIKDENMSTKNEDCYKVYSTIDPDSQPLSFNSWNEVEDHLNQAWGEYKASMAKENAEFGTDEDKDSFMGNFEVAIEPIEIPVEEIPAEGIELPVEPVIDEVPKNTEVEVCPECGEVNCICNNEENLEEDLEEPKEETEETEETEEEIKTPEEAADKVDEIEDAVDSLEDFLKTLIGDEELDTEEQEEINSLENEEQNEDFKDNMGMLTDINDLDFPDALAKAVDTKEDGSLYRISDVAKEVEEIKSSIEQLKNDFKTDLTNMLQDLKNDLKLSVNNVETKVQDTKSAVDNLTAEEEDIEGIEFEEPEAPVEEEGQEETPEENEEVEENEDEMEEAFDESTLKGNPIYENIKTIIRTNKNCGGKMSVPTIAEKLREDYGLNTKIGAIYNNVSEICYKTSIKESIIDLPEEQRLLKEATLGKAAKWLGGGLMSKLEQKKEKSKWENLEQVKQDIDKQIQAGANAEQLKNTITLASDNEDEEKQAKEYAIQKLQTTESLLKKLKNTSKTAKLNNLNIK